MDKMTLIIFIIIAVWAIVTTIRMISLELKLQKLEDHAFKFFKKQALLNVAFNQALTALEASKGPTYGHMEEDKTDETRS